MNALRGRDDGVDNGRLDKGQAIHMLSEEEKANVDNATQERARRMAVDAHEKRLREIDLTEFEADAYERLLAPVQARLHLTLFAI